MDVRDQIFLCAKTADVGPLTETLKWGQPSYLTEQTRAGSTIRLFMTAGRPAVFFNCNTSLVDGFRSDFPNTFRYEGNRAIVLSETFDAALLDLCLTRALTYHRTRRKGRAS